MMIATVGLPLVSRRSPQRGDRSRPHFIFTNRQVTLLGMLDLSAAFDCVDHLILLQRSERNFGLTAGCCPTVDDIIPDWQDAAGDLYDGRLSAIQRMRFGVPQGSVLGHLLFTIYTAEVSKIVINHGYQVHLYADDCQVYVSVQSKLRHRRPLGCPIVSLTLLSGLA